MDISKAGGRKLVPLYNAEMSAIEGELISDLVSMAKEPMLQESSEVINSAIAAFKDKSVPVKELRKKISVAMENVSGTVSAKSLPILQEHVQSVYNKTRRYVAARTGGSIIRPDMTLVDELAIDTLSRGNAAFIGDRYVSSMMKKRVEKKLKSKVESALERGISSADLAKEMEKEFGDVVAYDSRLWRTYASASLNRSKNWSMLRSFDKVGLYTYSWLAVGDERMCPICGGLNGQSFSVSRSVSQMNEALTSLTYESLKSVTPWIGRNAGGMYMAGSREPVDLQAMDSLTLQNLGVGPPPIHGLCRCNIVANLQEYDQPIDDKTYDAARDPDADTPGGVTFARKKRATAARVAVPPVQEGDYNWRPMSSTLLRVKGLGRNLEYRGYYSPLYGVKKTKRMYLKGKKRIGLRKKPFERRKIGIKTVKEPQLHVIKVPENLPLDLMSESEMMSVIAREEYRIIRRMRSVDKIRNPVDRYIARRKLGKQLRGEMERWKSKAKMHTPKAWTMDNKGDILMPIGSTGDLFGISQRITINTYGKRLSKMIPPNLARQAPRFNIYTKLDVQSRYARLFKSKGVPVRVRFKRGRGFRRLKHAMLKYERIAGTKERMGVRLDLMKDAIENPWSPIDPKFANLSRIDLKKQGVRAWDRWSDARKRQWILQRRGISSLTRDINRLTRTKKSSVMIWPKPFGAIKPPIANRAEMKRAFVKVEKGGKGALTAAKNLMNLYRKNQYRIYRYTRFRPRQMLAKTHYTKNLKKDGAAALNTSSKHALAHEFGHHIEMSSGELQRLTKAFFKVRTAGTRASRIHGFTMLEKKAFNGKFLHPYTGSYKVDWKGLRSELQGLFRNKAELDEFIGSLTASGKVKRSWLRKFNKRINNAKVAKTEIEMKAWKQTGPDKKELAESKRLFGEARKMEDDLRQWELTGVGEKPKAKEIASLRKLAEGILSVPKGMTPDQAMQIRRLDSYIGKASVYSKARRLVIAYHNKYTPTEVFSTGMEYISRLGHYRFARYDPHHYAVMRVALNNNARYWDPEKFFTSIGSKGKLKRWQNRMLKHKDEFGFTPDNVTRDDIMEYMSSEFGITWSSSLNKEQRRLAVAEMKEKTPRFSEIVPILDDKVVKDVKNRFGVDLRDVFTSADGNIFSPEHAFSRFAVRRKRVQKNWRTVETKKIRGETKELAEVKRRLDRTIRPLRDELNILKERRKNLESVGKGLTLEESEIIIELETKVRAVRAQIKDINSARKSKVNELRIVMDNRKDFGQEEFYEFRNIWNKKKSRKLSKLEKKEFDSLVDKKRLGKATIEELARLSNLKEIQIGLRTWEGKGADRVARRRTVEELGKARKAGDPAAATREFYLREFAIKNRRSANEVLQENIKKWDGMYKKGQLDDLERELKRFNGHDIETKMFGAREQWYLNDKKLREWRKSLGKDRAEYLAKYSEEQRLYERTKQAKLADDRIKEKKVYEKRAAAAKKRKAEEADKYQKKLDGYRKQLDNNKAQRPSKKSVDVAEDRLEFERKVSAKFRVMLERAEEASMRSHLSQIQEKYFVSDASALYKSRANAVRKDFLSPTSNDIKRIKGDIKFIKQTQLKGRIPRKVSKDVGEYKEKLKQIEANLDIVTGNRADKVLEPGRLTQIRRNHDELLKLSEQDKILRQAAARFSGTARETEIKKLTDATGYREMTNSERRALRRTSEILRLSSEREGALLRIARVEKSAVNELIRHKEAMLAYKEEIRTSYKSIAAKLDAKSEKFLQIEHSADEVSKKLGTWKESQRMAADEAATIRKEMADIRKRLKVKGISEQKKNFLDDELFDRTKRLKKVTESRQSLDVKVSEAEAAVKEARDIREDMTAMWKKSGERSVSPARQAQEIRREAELSRRLRRLGLTKNATEAQYIKELTRYKKNMDRWNENSRIIYDVMTNSTVRYEAANRKYMESYLDQVVSNFTKPDWGRLPRITGDLKGVKNSDLVTFFKKADNTVSSVVSAIDERFSMDAAIREAVRLKGRPLSTYELQELNRGILIKKNEIFESWMRTSGIGSRNTSGIANVMNEYGVVFRGFGKQVARDKVSKSVLNRIDNQIDRISKFVPREWIRNIPPPDIIVVTYKDVSALGILNPTAAGRAGYVSRYDSSRNAIIITESALIHSSSALARLYGEYLVKNNQALNRASDVYSKYKSGLFADSQFAKAEMRTKLSGINQEIARIEFNVAASHGVIKPEKRALYDSRKKSLVREKKRLDRLVKSDENVNYEIVDRGEEFFSKGFANVVSNDAAIAYKKDPGPFDLVISLMNDPRIASNEGIISAVRHNKNRLTEKQGIAAEAEKAREVKQVGTKPTIVTEKEFDTDKYSKLTAIEQNPKNYVDGTLQGELKPGIQGEIDRIKGELGL